MGESEGEDQPDNHLDLALRTNGKVGVRGNRAGLVEGCNLACLARGGAVGDVAGVDSFLLLLQGKRGENLATPLVA